MHKRPIIYLSIFLFFYHSSNTLIGTFLPLYFQDKALTGTEIGWIMAIGPFTSLFFQPFFGYMSDKYKTIKRMLFICLIGVIISSLVMFQVQGFLLLLLVCGVFFSLFIPIGALGDSLALSTALTAGASFGRIRMWGSAGFAVTSFLGGQILLKIGIGNLMYPYLLFALLTFAVCWKLTDVNVPADPVNLKGAVSVVLQPRFVAFLVFIMFVTIGHRTNDIYSGLYIKELGGNESLVGLSWFVGVTCEALIFMLSPVWIRWFNEMTFMVIAAALYGLRWILISAASAPLEVVWLQALHGITFGVFYLCAFQYATNYFPAKFRSTGQQVFISVFFGLSGIIGSLAGGMIFDHLSGVALYKLISYSAFAGCVGLVLYHSFVNKNKIGITHG
ncbi:MFS transporter [Bacillus sp. FJAT-29814]|uniref:MFS transporter n=1 Tax=Bacillus sp. FJAT-29814 TaxID=1729688 RepID=UPI0008299DF6|nr:MFS transporter [Bacillus sp. FJAT-29814]